MTIIYTTVGRNPLKEWSSPQSQRKSLKCSTCVQPQKVRMISIHFPGKQFNSTVIQVYALNTNSEEAEVERCYEVL